jgi:uncharacterized protein YndB with AHSA1/START domain
MNSLPKTVISIDTIVKVPIQKVWEMWTEPKHITKWNFASDDWQCPSAENDLQVGGKFSSRMEAKDGSFGFDFGGHHTEVEEFKKISSILEDGRKMTVIFETHGAGTKVIEDFEAENTNSIELQKEGWQAILNNFKKHAESQSGPQKLNFKIEIDAPIDKVYNTMLADKTYREWTAVFNPTSRFEGSWEQGSKIVFVGTDPDGKEGGMVSRIKENIKNQFVSIEHLGILNNGQEITSGPEVEGWAGAFENYTYEAKNGKTLLTVDLDSNEEFKSYFEETYPKALEKLKSICES